MKKGLLVTVILLVGMLFIPQAGYASPVISGVANFANGILTGTANYEVYAPGEAANGLGGDAYYHYFYYVSNTGGGSAEISLFSVGNPSNAPIISAGYLDRAAGDIAPESIVSLGSSVKYYFKPSGSFDFIYPTYSSKWLYFTTPREPAWVTGGIQDGGLNDFQPVPGPVPEPASMALVGMGLVGFVGKLFRRKFNA